jgi:hypothetical protein
VNSVKEEGSKRIMIKVRMGLSKNDHYGLRSGIEKTHEYHSHAEYSAVISSESVRIPEWEVSEAAMRAESCM